MEYHIFNKQEQKRAHKCGFKKSYSGSEPNTISMKFIRQETAPSKRPGDVDRLISDVGPSY